MLKERIMIYRLIPFLLFILIGYWHACAQNVASGNLVKHEHFKSQYVVSRDIYVWLPEGYSKSKRYSVVYMHDGNMLFDKSVTWNGQEWQIDEIAGELIGDKKTENFIIVGIPCSEGRFYEYFPKKTLNYLPEETLQRLGALKNKFCADEYLKFLVKELKPFIDKTYSTKSGVNNTFIMGSSMGGLVSLYAICEYPDVFGGSASLSIHTPMIAHQELENENREIWAKAFRDYLGQTLPKPNSRKIYLDRGDHTLDSLYAPYHEKLDELFVEKGWKMPYWNSRFFPGAAHLEKDWARRVALPLQFLLSNEGNEKIEKIDPPMWWCGMKNSQLQLMVYGNNIASYYPVIDYPNVIIKSVVPCESANYLLIYLDVEGARPGIFNIDFVKGKKKIGYKYELKERVDNASKIEGFSSADVIYLVMPDRFANGDTKNDEVKMNHPYMTDRHDLTKRHGGDLLGIEQHIDYIDDLGVTAVWLNPVLENDMGEGSYHGYAATDYYKVDPRLGTNEDYRRLVDKLHQKGIKVIKDMVFNHCGSNHVWLKDKPMRDWFNNPYNYVQTNHNKSVFYDPYAADIDRSLMTDGWFVPTMPDLNQRNSHVATYLIQNSIWWIEYARLNGIRQDTYPYADKEMMERWCNEVFDEYPDFNIVGESWINQPVGSAYWQRGGNFNKEATLKSTMDFHLQSIAAEALKEETDWDSGMQRIFEHFSLDFCYPDVKNVLRFLENHDTDRFFNTPVKNIDIFKQSIALLLTVPGIPQLYYGQELMADGSTKKDYAFVRQDMLGGWKEDSISVFEASGRTMLQQEALAFTQKMLKWRKGNKVISEGSMKHYVPRKGVYVYERRLGDKAIMVLLNGTSKDVLLPLEPYKETLSGCQSGQDVLDGISISLQKDIFLPARGTKVIELY